jgi:hypothetical protein
MRLVAIGLAAVAAFGLTGCTSTVDLDPAESANDPLCADITSNLPGTVSDQPRRCETVAGVDWIIDDSDAPRFRLTTFGRTPAVEIYLDTTADDDGEGASSRDVLDALSPIVSVLPVDGQCLERGDATPAP